MSTYTILMPNIDEIIINPNPVDAGATMIISVEVE